MRTIAFALLLALPLTTAAQLYSWKDASGRTVFSDTPPPGKTEARKLRAPPPPANDPEALRKSFMEKESAERDRAKKAGEAEGKTAEEKAQAEQKASNCARAKSNLSSMESGQIRFTTDAKGERIALEGDVRERELAEARKSVDSWCK